MTDRKLSAPNSNARRMAVSTIAATLLSATGLSVDTAAAQQPPPAPLGALGRQDGALSAAAERPRCRR